MDNELAQIHQKVKRELADFLGADMEDIEDDTTLREDLHMDPANMTDFMAILTKAGMDVEGIDLTEIETFGELVESLTAHI